VTIAISPRAQPAFQRKYAYERPVVTADEAWLCRRPGRGKARIGWGAGLLADHACEPNGSGA